MSRFPVVGLVGARQVGKTTLAKMICAERQASAIYLDLELDEDVSKLQQPQMYLEQHKGSLVVIDEIQRKPELFALLRALVDADRRPGRFLVLGSASPALLRQSSESLAGRICYHELLPLAFDEIGAPENINRLWLRGGFPESYLAESDRDSVSWRESFIKTYLERDIPSFGIRVPAVTLKRFWTMLAHSHGQVWNASKMASSLGVSYKAVQHYLDILEDTFMVRRVQPFHANVKKRLIKSPKVYFRDSGILHSLLRIYDTEDLLGHPALGSSWEGWCVEQIHSILPDQADVSFYRTRSGAEIDLLIRISSSGPALAVEIKRSLDCKPSRGFWSAMEDIQPAKGYIIYPGHERYPVSGGVWALPAAELTGILESSHGERKE